MGNSHKEEIEGKKSLYNFLNAITGISTKSKDQSQSPSLTPFHSIPFHSIQTKAKTKTKPALSSKGSRVLFRDI
jgi:hypothetical protein